MPHPAPRPASAWQRHLPNALTTLRLLLAAVFVALLSWPANIPQNKALLLAATACFTLAAVTDALDGLLARRWNVVSVFGRIADPLADKVLILAAYTLLSGPAFTILDPAQPTAPAHSLTGVAPWMVVVLLTRELLITTLRATLEGRGVDFSATLAGKLKMIAQSIVAPVILLVLALADDPRHGLARWAPPFLAWAVTLITAWSAVPYIARAVRATLPRTATGTAAP